MVRIIKEGTIKHQIDCKKCGCIFEFEAEDVTEVTAWDDHGGHYPVANFYKIDCPYCKREVDVSGLNDLMEEKHKMKHVDR